MCIDSHKFHCFLQKLCKQLELSLRNPPYYVKRYTEGFSAYLRAINRKCGRSYENLGCQPASHFRQKFLVTTDFSVMQANHSSPDSIWCTVGLTHSPSRLFRYFCQEQLLYHIWCTYKWRISFNEVIIRPLTWSCYIL